MRAARAAHIRDGQFDKRRVIDGIRVLVRTPSDAGGIVSENFLVRIKHAAFPTDYTFTGHYYWQAFNDAKQRLKDATRT